MISDKAKTCPKCGYVIKSPTAENRHDNNVQNQSIGHQHPSRYNHPRTPNNGLKWIMIVLAVCIFGGFVSYYFYHHQKVKMQIAEAARLDSIAKAEEAARLEALRLDSIRQDSIKWCNFSSPDLAFHDLHGHVKSYRSSMNHFQLPNSGKFDKSGNWSNQPSRIWEIGSDAYYSEWFPELKGKRPYERNKDGFIAVRHEVSDMEGHIVERYQWADGKLKTIATHSDFGDLSFEYNEDGLLHKLTQESNGGEGWRYRLKMITFSNYKFDESGNWISRTVSISEKEVDDIGIESKTNRSYSEKRTINYYTREEVDNTII